MAFTVSMDEVLKKTVILMAPFFGAGGPIQLCLQHLCRPGLHRSSGLQKAKAIRMTNRAAWPRPFQSKSTVHRNRSSLLTEKRELIAECAENAEERSLSIGFFYVAAGLVCLTGVRVACKDRFVSLHREVSFLQQVVHLSRG